MIYLICQDWQNTSNNHAGIKYFCNKISELYPETYTSIVFPDYYSNYGRKHFKIIRKYYYILSKIRHRYYLRTIQKGLLRRINFGDKVILMEYMEKMYPMLPFARKFKLSKPNIPLYAMVHLVPMKLKTMFRTKTLNTWVSAVDKILTLGHSLSSFFYEYGVDSAKIVTLFHPVDEFYYTRTPIRAHNNIRVIAMGNQMRDMDMLAAIIKANPDVQFVVFQGVANLSDLLGNITNVKLVSFVDETELRQYMSESDISLNVMYDTVGSNVIVTSLGMGLAMLCSDVGSIRDYCNDENAMFCKSVSDFSEALKLLVMDRDRLSKMQLAAAEKGRELSVDNFVKVIGAI